MSTGFFLEVVMWFYLCSWAFERAVLESSLFEVNTKAKSMPDFRRRLWKRRASQKILLCPSAEASWQSVQRRGSKTKTQGVQLNSPSHYLHNLWWPHGPPCPLLRCYLTRRVLSHMQMMCCGCGGGMDGAEARLAYIRSLAACGPARAEFVNLWWEAKDRRCIFDITSTVGLLNYPHTHLRTSVVTISWKCQLLHVAEAAEVTMTVKSHMPRRGEPPCSACEAVAHVPGRAQAGCSGSTHSFLDGLGCSLNLILQPSLLQSRSLCWLFIARPNLSGGFWTQESRCESFHGVSSTLWPTLHFLNVKLCWWLGDWTDSTRKYFLFYSSYTTSELVSSPVYMELI